MALMIERVGVPIVVGSGIAGLATALQLGNCVVLTKDRLESGSSDRAQGGIAAAVGPGDDPAAHAADTIAVGAGLVDEVVARMITGDGPGRISWLQLLGARFDRSPAGHLALGREAGHRASRIVHANGDGTGREVMRVLRAAVAGRPDITVVEHAAVIDLVRAGGRVAGVVVSGPPGTQVMLAPAVVLATGGIGHVYAKTTNPPAVSGDGLAVAARAGAALADVEFVQFHPTALDAASDPLPLLTEALRGAGALLVDGSGRCFMTDLHPAAELAPRDIVARAVWHETSRRGAYLDARTVPRLAERFPTVLAGARAAGFDAAVTPLPVTPAAHYHMGGVATDAAGRTSLTGLYACGEVAATGLHGANRLASNSLLEGLVFADRVAAAVRGDAVPRETPAIVEIPAGDVPSPDGDRAAIDAARRAVWQGAGVVRDETGLTALLGEIEDLAPRLDRSIEGRNLAVVARLVASAALRRRESRGSHYRSDYPDTGAPAAWTLVTPEPVDVRPLAARHTTREHVA